MQIGNDIKRRANVMPRNCTVAESKKLSVAQLYGNTEALWGRMRCKCSQSQKQQDAKTDAPVQLSSVESPIYWFLFLFFALEITESFQLEKTFKITRSHRADILSPITKACPLVPHPRLLVPSGGGDFSTSLSQSLSIQRSALMASS